METKQIEKLGTDFDALIDKISGEALKLSQTHLANAEAEEKAWSDLYESVPAGRLRTLPEVAAVLASRQAAHERVVAIGHEINRFTTQGPGGLPSRSVA